MKATDESIDEILEKELDDYVYDPNKSVTNPVDESLNLGIEINNEVIDVDTFLKKQNEKIPQDNSEIQNALRDFVEEEKDSEKIIQEMQLNMNELNEMKTKVKESDIKVEIVPKIILAEEKLSKESIQSTLSLSGKKENFPLDKTNLNKELVQDQVIDDSILKSKRKQAQKIKENAEKESRIQTDIERMTMMNEDFLSKKIEEYIGSILFQQFREILPKFCILEAIEKSGFKLEPLPSFQIPSNILTEDITAKLIIQTPMLPESILAKKKMNENKINHDLKNIKKSEINLDNFLKSINDGKICNTIIKYKIKQEDRPLILKHIQCDVDLKFEHPTFKMYSNYLERQSLFSVNSNIWKMQRVFTNSKSEQMFVRLPIIETNKIAYKEEDEIENLINEIEPTKESEIVERKNANISDLSLCNHFVNCRRMILSLNKISEIDGLTLCTKIEELNLNQNRISSINPKSLQILQKLRILKLQFNKLKSVEGIDSCESLEEIDLFGNMLQNVDALNRCIFIKILNLEKNEIRNVPNFNNLNHLQKLNLGNNKIIDISGLANNSSIPLLTELILSSNSIREIPDCLGWPLLKKIYFNNNKIEVLNLGANPILENLYASDNKIVHILKLSGCPILKYVDLSFNSIMEYSTIFEGLMTNSLLEGLKINDNQLNKTNFPTIDHYLQKVFMRLKTINEINISSRSSSCIFIKDKKSEPDLNAFIISYCQRLNFFQKFELISNNRLLHYFVNTQEYHNASENFSKESLNFITTEHKAMQANPISTLINHTNKSFFDLKKNILKIIKFLKSIVYGKKQRIKFLGKNLFKIIKIQSYFRGHKIRKNDKLFIWKIKEIVKNKNLLFKKLQEFYAKKIQGKIKNYLRIKRIKSALSRVKYVDPEIEEIEKDNLDDFFKINEKPLEYNLLHIPKPERINQLLEMNKLPPINMQSKNSMQLPPIILKKKDNWFPKSYGQENKINFPETLENAQDSPRQKIKLPPLQNSTAKSEENAFNGNKINNVNSSKNLTGTLIKDDKISINQKVKLMAEEYQFKNPETLISLKAKLLKDEKRKKRIEKEKEAQKRIPKFQK